MAVKTTFEQIEEIDAAISAVMDGQEVSRGGKRLVFADLKTLFECRERLLSRYNAENGSGLTVVTGIVKRD